MTLAASLSLVCGAMEEARAGWTSALKVVVMLVAMGVATAGNAAETLEEPSEDAGLDTMEAPLDEPPPPVETIAEEQAEGPVIRRIRWRGLEAFDEDDLEGRIVTTPQPWLELRFWRPKRRLDVFTLEEDVERIEEAYREIGYFGAEVDSRVDRIAEGEVAVEFIVEEGSQVSLESWSLDIRPRATARPEANAGESERKDLPSQEEIERLRSYVAFEPGRPFGSKLYRDRRSDLLEEAGELGFASARVSGGATVDPEAGVARVDWTLHLGPRTFFGEIDVEGLEGVDEKIVRRELAFEEGDRFSSSAIEKSERRLVETGLFRAVVIGRPREAAEQRQAAADRIDIEVLVEEAPPRTLRMSVGYGTQDGPRGEIGLDWRNFTGQGRRLRTRAFASFLDVGFEGSLGQPYLFGGRARADLGVTALRQDRPGYEAFVTGATTLLTIRPERESPWSLVVGPGVELARITDFKLDVGNQLRGPRESIIVNWFTIARYENVDRILDPRSGFRVELGNELGGFPIGSDLDYHRWHLDVRAYRPMGPVVWAARASATTLDPIGAGLADVPLTRRLYSGGNNSIRGFDFQKLGPTDAANDPIGGASRMELGVELRVPVWRWIGLVGFVDAGDVRLDPWSFRPADLRVSAGPGLRIDTPVGPLRFDMGFPLNPPDGVDPFRFHFSVGHVF